MRLEWRGEGVEEKGILVHAEAAELKARIGETLVAVDRRYFRPAEVETLLGDASKARVNLGWSPRTSFRDLVAEMAEGDLAEVKRLVKLRA